MDYYKRNRVDSGLETATANVIQKKTSQPPKSRARGAEARALVTSRDETAVQRRGDVGRRLRLLPRTCVPPV